jgi:hypothetical protein
MAGWPDEGKGMFTIKRPVYCSNCAPCGMESCIERIRSDIGITVEMVQEYRFRTALSQVFGIVGVMDTMHLFKGGRFRKNRRDPGRETREGRQQARVALRMARIVVTGTGRIEDDSAAFHIRYHQVLAGIHDFACSGLSFFVHSAGHFLEPSEAG